LIAGGHELLLALMNWVAHILMYFYYLVANIKPEYKNSIWWKKYITQLQMVTISHIAPLSILDQLSQGHESSFHVYILVF
jgi:hypothetical protein